LVLPGSALPAVSTAGTVMPGVTGVTATAASASGAGVAGAAGVVAVAPAPGSMLASNSGLAVSAPGTSGTLGRATGRMVLPATLSSPLTIVPSGRTVTVRTRRLTRPSSPASVAGAIWVTSLRSAWSRDTSCSSAPGTTPLISLKTTDCGAAAASG